MLGGDINEILEEIEKMGGPKKERKFLDDFKKTMDDCDLRDLKPRGEIFTWHGNRRGSHIWKRLDRFLCNYHFDSIFIDVEAYNLDWLFSDHRPIKFKIDRKHSNPRRGQNKPFKFEELWTRHEACGELISNNGQWEGSNFFLSSLSFDLNSCSHSLSKWGKEINIRRKKRINKCKLALRDAYKNLQSIDFDSIHKNLNWINY